MGRSVGGLERLHHLLLPGRRRPVQGETFKISVSFFFFSNSVVMHLSAESSGFVCAVMNVLFSLKLWLQAGGGVKPDSYSCIQELRCLHCRCLFT